MDTQLEQMKLEHIRQQFAAVKIDNESLQAENARIQAHNATIHAQLQQAQSRYACAHRRLRFQAALAFSALLGAVLFAPAGRAAIAQGYVVTLATLNTRLLAVESKTQYMSVDATAQSTTFSGCNLVVNDGGGSTDTIVTNAAKRGIGNVIIGYNASRAAIGQYDIRTGSHNLIVGDLHNYSSYGGIVAGNVNAISGAYACVTGGIDNTASGGSSCVSGGENNTAEGAPNEGYSSSVSGGVNNTASNYGSSISGGNGITVSGKYAWAAGGYHSP